MASKAKAPPPETDPDPEEEDQDPDSEEEPESSPPPSAPEEPQEEPQAIAEVDLDEMVEEKVRKALGARRAPEKSGGGGDDTGHVAPPPDVKQAVRDVLEQDEHRRQHEVLAAPKPPRPKRGLLSTFLFGPRAD